MSKSNTLRVGKKVTITAGTKVTVRGSTYKRDRDTQVTIRDIETTRTNKTKIYWKSNGYMASAIL